MKHFSDNIEKIPLDLDVDSDEYNKWKEEYLDDCGLYARHIIADELEEEEWRRRND